MQIIHNLQVNYAWSKLLVQGTLQTLFYILAYTANTKFRTWHSLILFQEYLYLCILDVFSSCSSEQVPSCLRSASQTWPVIWQYKDNKKCLGFNILYSESKIFSYYNRGCWRWCISCFVSWQGKVTGIK